MRSIDPECEAAGRTVAAMLVAREIRQGGPVHLETILTEIGALPGFAAQMSIRKAIIEPQKLDPNEILPGVVTTNGEKYYFSDTLNCIVFENLARPPYTSSAPEALAKNRKYGLAAEATTGPLPFHRWHEYDDLHRLYSNAVEDLMNRFMQEHNVKAEQMTPDHARAVLKAVAESENPLIRAYRAMLQHMGRLYRLRSGGRGSE